MTILQECEGAAHSVSGVRHNNSTRFFHSQNEVRASLDGKRILDIIGASVLLFLTFPLMLLIYVLLSLAGSPIFAQLRVGRSGKVFNCYKFRTMRKNADHALADYLRSNPDAEREWAANFKLANDPRITRIGGFLRRTSLDELPQLINVLKGEMSLVGPRPIVTDEIARYENKIRAYYLCRPGLTGLWQINGRNLVTYDKRVLLDAYYARKQSVAFDLAILFKTVFVVLSGYGAR